MNVIYLLNNNKSEFQKPTFKYNNKTLKMKQHLTEKKIDSILVVCGNCFNFFPFSIDKYKNKIF